MSRSLRLCLVAGFLITGLLNLAFNPFESRFAFASDDCDGDPPCCVNGTVQAQCEDGEWVCSAP
jgi:hypothetical protein